MKRHILICGDRGVGKSTLICRLLEAAALRPGGFYTKMESGAGGIVRPVYLYPADVAASCRSRRPENLVGRCDAGGCREIFPEIFNTLGVYCLRGAPEKEVIVMDELGFMESGSLDFCREVLRCLDGDVPVLAAVKNRMEIPFLQQVCAHPQGVVYVITPENREELYLRLLPEAQSWRR